MLRPKKKRGDRINHINPRRVNEGILTKLDEAEQLLKAAKNILIPETRTNKLNEILGIYKNSISEMWA